MYIIVSAVYISWSLEIAACYQTPTMPLCGQQWVSRLRVATLWVDKKYRHQTRDLPFQSQHTNHLADQTYILFDLSCRHFCICLKCVWLLNENFGRNLLSRRFCDNTCWTIPFLFGFCGPFKHISLTIRN